VSAFINEWVPEAEMVESIGMEMTYQLPNDKGHTATYEKLFHDLDANLGSLGVLSYGVSDTTLEEVFLKVASESEETHFLSEEDVRQGTEQMTDG
jgi:ATP-binding cassette subfamily A (ABC1) protein 1